MKRLGGVLVFFALLVWVVPRLWHRSLDEQIDHKVGVLAEWADVRLASDRTGQTHSALLEQLKVSGVTGIVISQATVSDLGLRNAQGRRLRAVPAIEHQLLVRGIQPGALWESVKDTVAGYDPMLLRKIQESGLGVVLRVDQDPWLSPTDLFQELETLFTVSNVRGVLLNTDSVPGGTDSLSLWRQFLEQHQGLLLFSEFKPSKSSRALAARVPKLTYRVHSIGTNEYKDLTPMQEEARWARALRERSCRFLLVRSALEESWNTYLQRLSHVSQIVRDSDFTLDWPSVRATWVDPNVFERRIFPFFALFLAIASPVLSLGLAQRQKPWVAFLIIVLGTLTGASLVAAIADSPLTRLQITPFRGVKVAFLLAWVGSFAILFRKEDLRQLLEKPVRRVDAVLLLFVAAVMSYFLMRTGNAGASWTVGGEQHLRHTLEQIFVARPRFKEFVLGYPLLLLGLHARDRHYAKLLIGVGMIGPISMVNTFCHLHSPLYLAYWRSANGILLGALIGAFLVFAQRWRIRS